MIGFLEQASKFILGSAGMLTFFSVNTAEKVVDGTLKLTAAQLEFLSVLFNKESEWGKKLYIASNAVQDSAAKTEEAMQEALENCKQAFGVAENSVQVYLDSLHTLLYDSKFLSSLVGSVHDNRYGISKIQLNFRDNGKDISPNEAYLGFENSDKSKSILYLPGLFCDETLWRDSVLKTDEGEIFQKGIADHFLEKNFYPLFIRYNPGLHISENGKSLLDRFDNFFMNDSKKEVHILAYSQGGLVLRSALYYARIQKKEWLQRLGKIIIVSCPNYGSYLEKFGYYAGMILEHSPFPVAKELGFIGNLRSDGIKDLSHGIIRTEDWNYGTQAERYLKAHYFGELDEFDAYQIYSFAFPEKSLSSELVGDGIIEGISLRKLDKVYQSKENPSLRTKVIYGYNHFSILSSPDMIPRLEEILLTS
ncbi:MAG: hypothetical protein SFU98_02010 [Leptospiraceae bacterium]|nr:hypothetical protein [Leptospiraceae bacterium]